MERSEAGSKKCKGNEVKLVNPNILRFSCASGVEDGNIPEWLLVEVLVRLPVKSVFRFKLVCRKWLSLISDPYFVRVYVSRASLLSPQQSWTIVAPFMHHKDSQFSHLDYELLKDLYVKPSLCIVGVPSIHRSQEEEKDMYTIFGVSNGLVLYWRCNISDFRRGYVVRNYYICNPLTGHGIALPPLASRVDMRGWGFHTHVEDGLLKSYRVVQVEPLYQRSNLLIFRVYVSEIGEWKDFTVRCHLSPLYINKDVAVLNGIMHWIAEGHGIIAYDPYKNPESMCIIAFPNDVGGEMGSSYLSVEYRGKLRYFKEGMTISGVAFPSFKVWVLNDYSSRDWCLQHNIIQVNVEYVANFPSQRFYTGPMCFHPFDSDIVYLRFDGCCVSYNMKTRKLQVEDEFFRHGENAFGRKPPWGLLPFVIPHWPISIPRPSHGAIEG